MTLHYNLKNDKYIQFPLMNILIMTRGMNSQ